MRGKVNLVQKHIINNFKHKVGLHCESSAMRDLFEFHGFPMSEAIAFGLEGSMGIGFFDNSNDLSNIIDSEVFSLPFFIGGKQDTISPTSLSCRILGINLKKQSFSSADKGWTEAKRLIDQDIPLILRADIAYLPYMFEEEREEIHFGGHTIALGGYDEETGIAYIGDTEYEGFQEIKIEDLKQARSSEHGQGFMRPNNTQFSMEPKADGKRPPFAAGVKLAIKKVVDNMLRPSMNHQGLQGLKRFANSILKWTDILKGQVKDAKSGKVYSKAQLVFELLHGYIETWGTGGSAFRILYTKFLEDLVDLKELKEGPRAWNQSEFKILEECIPLIQNSSRHWTLLAETTLKAANEYKEECLNHISLEELYNIGLYIASTEEELFTKLSKIKI